MKPHLPCAEQQVSRSNLTQILRLSRRKIHLLNHHYIWNLIYNARSNRCHCHAERLIYLIIITYQTSFTMRGATGVTLQPHQMLRLPRKMTRRNFKEKCMKTSKNRWNVISNAGTIREWSENETVSPQPASQVRLLFEAHQEHFLLKNRTFRAQSYIQTFTKCCACHKKWHLNFTKYCTCHEK